MQSCSQFTLDMIAVCNSFMNRRIRCRSSTEAGSETARRTHRCRFCSKLCGVGPACQHTHTHTVLSWPAASLHNYRTRIPQPADACLACRLTHRCCCRRYGYTVECRGPRLHARPSTAGAAGRTLLPTTQPLQPLMLLLLW